MAIPIIPTGPEDRKIADAVTGAFRKIFATIALLNGRLIDATLTVAKDNAVQHSLGRPAKGWFVVNADVAATYYQSKSTNPVPNQQILLVPSATANVTLWVF